MSRTNDEEGYNVATNILGMEPSDPLASDLCLEPRLPNMSILGGQGG